jgi:hypothetical protein
MMVDMAKYVTNSRGISARRTMGADAAKQAGPRAQAAATRGMKKVTGGGSALAQLGEVGENRHLAVVASLQETDHTWGRGSGVNAPTVPLAIEREAIAEVAGGASPRAVEVKYDLQQGYVRHALQRRFGSPEAAMQALRGLVTENALACMVQAAGQVGEMSGPQAVVAGAILIDKVIALDKTLADKPKTIDFSELAAIGKTLKVLREIAAPEGN